MVSQIKIVFVNNFEKKKIWYSQVLELDSVVMAVPVLRVDHLFSVCHILSFISSTIPQTAPCAPLLTQG